VRVLLLTAGALVGFAANSLLTRAALGTAQIDAASFTLVRLLSGAVVLTLLARVRPRASTEGGSWTSALALAGYAVFFTLAYRRIGAGVGALVLFGTVQITMIGTGLVRGERPAPIDWAGLALALAGLLALTLPGASAPDAMGICLMAVAGIGWGAYSLAGRTSRDPLGATAGNFVRATAGGALFVAASVPGLHATPGGLGLAAASGSVASGVGYALWYAVLPAIPAWRASVVQLTVPVLTALVAGVLLDEAITVRLAVATVLVAAGVWLTVAPALHRG
jgi:drug/metabolite transporter (DMT)-like permease